MFVFDEIQSRSVGGIVITEYQPSTIVLIVIGILSLFNLVVERIKKLSEVKGRSVGEDETTVHIRLVAWSPFDRVGDVLDKGGQGILVNDRFNLSEMYADHGNQSRQDG